MCAALRKIRGHIRHTGKFDKAAALLRKLLDDGALSEHFRQQTFQVLCEALAFLNTGAEGPERKAVRRLLDSVEARAAAFDAAQRSHIDAWRLRVIMPLHLAGDDGFVYNKAARNVRELIEALPAVGPDEDAALQRIEDGKWDEARVEGVVRIDAEDTAAPDPAQAEPKAEPAPDAPAVPENGGTATAPADGNTADPFGLESHISPPAQAHTGEAEPGRAGMVWTAAEVQAVRRQALLEGLEAMRRQCWQPWARSAAHLALGAAKQHRDRFLGRQQGRLQELIDFLRTSKATGIGPSSAQLKQDANAYETARKEWSGMTASGRGKVGGAGDGANVNWLG